MFYVNHDMYDYNIFLIYLLIYLHQEVETIK